MRPGVDAKMKWVDWDETLAIFRATDPNDERLILEAPLP